MIYTKSQADQLLITYAGQVKVGTIIRISEEGTAPGDVYTFNGVGWELIGSTSPGTGGSGVIGPKGDKGDKGDPGEPGPKGDKGDRGDPGTFGLKGDPGPEGPQGLQGYTGVRGEKGDKGDVGVQGEKGDTGEIGPKGDKGDVGVQGEKGDKGDTGPTGEIGPTGLKGDPGPEGKSAYEVAVAAGFGGSEEQWLDSLKGVKGESGITASLYTDAQANGFTGTYEEFALTMKGESGGDGKSAFELAILNGFVGSEAQWLASLKGDRGLQGDKGDPGPEGKSAYEVAVAAGFVGSEEQWLNGLKGEKGESGITASLYADAQANGFTGTYEEFALTMKGESGGEGKSAYEVAVAAGFGGSEEQWLDSLKGEKGDQGPQGDPGPEGKSAYEVAALNGFVGTEAEWIESLSSLSPDVEASLRDRTTHSGVQLISTVSGLTEILEAKANLNDPAFIGTPTAPTPPRGTNTPQLATTAFVQDALSSAGETVTSGSVITALRSVNPFLEYTESQAWTGEDRSSITIQRNASYTGGGENSWGNRCVGKAVQINTTTNATHSNAEYALWAGVQSYANLDPAATTIGQSWPQNVGIFAGGFQYGSAPVWAANFSVQNKSGLPQQLNYGAVVGLELNVGITGKDDYRSSVGISLVPQPMSGTTSNPWVAYWSAGDTNNAWQYGFFAQTGTEASFYSNAAGVRGMDLAGNYTVGLDLSSATISGSAVRIRSNDFISLDAYDENRIKFNPNTGCIEFYNHGTRRGFINMDSGADVDLASGTGGAVNYVHPALHLPSIIAQDANNRFVTDAEKATWNAKQAAGTYATGTGSASGVNTGDETAATIKSKLGVTTLSGSNTGDQVIPTTLPASDVYAWAKAATKPTYTYTEVGAAAASHTQLSSTISDLAATTRATTQSQITAGSGITITAWGSGATATLEIASAASLSSSFVSIKSYGAVGNGTTDDTAAMIAAESANSSVYWPAGNYRLTQAPKLGVSWGPGICSHATTGQLYLHPAPGPVSEVFASVYTPDVTGASNAHTKLQAAIDYAQLNDLPVTFQRKAIYRIAGILEFKQGRNASDAQVWNARLNGNGATLKLVAGATCAINVLPRCLLADSGTGRGWGAINLSDLTIDAYATPSSVAISIGAPGRWCDAREFSQIRDILVIGSTNESSIYQVESRHLNYTNVVTREGGIKLEAISQGSFCGDTVFISCESTMYGSTGNVLSLIASSSGGTNAQVRGVHFTDCYFYLATTSIYSGGLASQVCDVFFNSCQWDAGTAGRMAISIRVLNTGEVNGIHFNSPYIVQWPNGAISCGNSNTTGKISDIFVRGGQFGMITGANATLFFQNVKGVTISECRLLTCTTQSAINIDNCSNVILANNISTAGASTYGISIGNVSTNYSIIGNLLNCTGSVVNDYSTGAPVRQVANNLKI